MGALRADASRAAHSPCRERRPSIKGTVLDARPIPLGSDIDTIMTVDAYSPRRVVHGQMDTHMRQCPKGSVMALSLSLATLFSACTSGEAAPGPAGTIATTTTTTTAVATTPASSSPTTTRALRPPSEIAAAYLTEALDLMHEYSINRDKVDWHEIEALAVRLAEGAEMPENTYYAIRTAMGQLGDNHSVFFTPDEAADFDEGPASFTTPPIEVRDDGIGYVSVGRYIGNIGPQADAFATDLARRVATELDRTCGWIVDLRANSGGNMWPMVGGLAPLLGTGSVGSFTYPGGRTESWELVDGIALWDGMAMVEYGTTTNTDMPVAVLVGRRTASSGEALTIAFSGRPDTRLFGQPTAGFTTSNEPLWLSDGAMMALTMSVFTDRTGLAYGFEQSVIPDEIAGPDSTARGDEPLTLAAAWLLEQPACER